jgi:Uncharacterized protein conserved in bacteria (DUF2125)
MRKRWIIGGIVVLALATGYTGYWFWLAKTFERNLALWIDQQRALGYQISYTPTQPTGFPFSAEILLTDVAINSPIGTEPLRFTVPSMQLRLAPWQPLTLRIRDSEATTGYRMEWKKDGHGFQLSAVGIKTTIDLSTGTAPPMVAFDAERLELQDGGKLVAGTYQLTGEIVPSSSDASPESSIEFSFYAYQMNLLGGPEIYSPFLEGKVVGEIPLGAPSEALARWTSRGGYLDVTSISANPEPGFLPRFEASASIALDPRLQPIGSGTVTLYDYIPAIDRAVAEGHMTSDQANAIKIWLSAKSQIDNGKLKAALPITLQDGFVSTGPIKLARVPPIQWE